MYAIVEIAGQQFKVQQDQRVIVHRLDASEGDKLKFDNVLLIDDNGAITVGAPAIDGASIEASVNRHLKGDKVIVFKKKKEITKHNIKSWYNITELWIRLRSANLLLPQIWIIF